MIFRQLFDHNSHTYTYLIADAHSRQACVIDPVLERSQQYLQLLAELNLSLAFALDTHVHADHVTAIGHLRKATGCLTMVGSQGDIACSSESLQHGKKVMVGDLCLQVLYTPGHTLDSYCFYLEHEGESFLFSGDTLLIRGTGRTDFQNGNSEKLFHSLHKQLMTLPKGTQVYPAHDYHGRTKSTIAEERSHNPRLQLSKNEFIEFMDTLNLPDPKMMDIAVPANLSCGELGV